jgi:hypothetical protein
MSERENQQDINGLIDSLLAEYSNVDARPGMETRILATLRAESSAQPGRLGWWRWILAGAGALAVTVAVFGIYISIPPLPAPPKISAVGPPRLPGPPARSGVIAAATHRTLTRPRGTVQTQRGDERVAASVESVRQEVFPTPTPLSDQERLLFRYLASTPQREIIAQSHSDEPAAPMPFSPLALPLPQFFTTEGQSIR